MARRRAEPAEPATARTRWLPRPWTAVIVGVVAAGVIWSAAGALVRRAQGLRLPPVPDLARVAGPVRAAIVAADRAARRDPGSPEAVGALGRAYHGAQLEDPAVAAYEAAARLEVTSWTWPYLAALVHEQRGRADAAERALRIVVERRPDVGIAWFRLGESAFKQGRLDEAVEAYERARTVTAVPPAGARDAAPGARAVPLAVYAEVGLARVAIERGEAGRAVAWLDEALRREPRHGPALRLLAELRDASGDAAAGRGLRQAASGVRPYVPPADPLLDLVVDGSSDVEVLLRHAALAGRGGDRARRETLTRRAFALSPDDPDVVMAMAGVHQAAGRHEEALPLLGRHAGLVPGDHHTLTETGRSLIALGRYGEAEAVLRRVVVADAAATFNLGLALDRQGRWVEARARYERALAIDPFHARAANNLGAGLARRGELPAALSVFARAIGTGADSAELQSNFGGALLQAGRAVEGLRALERAVDLEPDHADARNNLGVALAELGRTAEAAARFREALRLAPGHAGARRNLERLGASMR